jgi:signal peptidase II
MKLGLSVAAAALVLDQVTKLYFYDLLVASGRRGIEVLPFFNLVTVWNYGISFGMFNNGSAEASIIFVVLALAIVVALLMWLRTAGHPLVAAALGLVIGGAIGNVIDRLRFGAVFDFLDFHIGGWHWPAFNVADSAITIGVVLLCIDALFLSARSAKKAP